MAQPACSTVVQDPVWSAGNYVPIGTRLVFVAELLSEELDMRAGTHTLDIATGHGNAALASARRGCLTSAVDRIPELLECASARAHAEQLTIDFRVADAVDLPFAGGSFDTVLSVFGLQFVEDAHAAANEVVRVLRPGGTLAMANWVPSGLASELFGLLAVPDVPPLFPWMAAWSDIDALMALFPGNVDFELTARTFTHRYATPEAFGECFRQNFGPAVLAFAGRDASGQDELAESLIRFAQLHSRANDGSVLLDFDYMQCIARFPQDSGALS